jgi:hypothetical protein
MLQFERRMGCTTTDLLRWLPQALGELYIHTNLIVDGKTFLNVENPQLQIDGFVQSPRKIALLEIPVLELKIRFSSSWTNDGCQTALNRFDLYTRRGGG